MSKLFLWKKFTFRKEIDKWVSCFFPPTTPRNSKSIHNAALKYIAHNITQYFPPMKTLLHFHFSSNIFLFSRELFSHDTYPYSKKHSHSSTLEHIKIYLFLPFVGDRVWGCTCVNVMYGCVNVSCTSVRVLHDELSKLRVFQMLQVRETFSDVHSLKFPNELKPARKNSKFNNWRVRKLSRFFTTAILFLPRQNFKVRWKWTVETQNAVKSFLLDFFALEGKFWAFTHEQNARKSSENLLRFLI
jgi:hypothetical protein